MNKVKIIVISAIIAFRINSAYAGDLMTDYMNSNSSRGSADYRFGVSMSAPYANNTIATFHGNANLQHNCGAFGALASLTASFNASAMENLGTALLSGIPVLLLCYASQTLCDAYKFARNLANAAASLSTANCQQIEKMAEQTGDAMRKAGVESCIQAQNPVSSQDYVAAANQCESSSSFPIKDFSGNLNAQFKLSDYVSSISSNPNIQSVLNYVAGDLQFNSSGIAGMPAQRGLETMQSTYSQTYYSAIKNTIENSISTGAAPQQSDLNTISVPGYPVTQYFASRLAAMPVETRESFYGQYSTVAATITVLTKIQDLEDTLEVAKTDAGDPSKTKAVQGLIDKLKTRMDYLMKQLEIQKNYLVPMIQSVMEYKVPTAQPAPTAQDIQSEMSIKNGIGN